MNKYLKWFFLIMFIIFSFQYSTGISEKATRKWTIMVYMCGSNLESRNGAASADIREMLESDVDSKEVSVLVFVGGSENWHMGYNPDQSSILEISKGRNRIVWSSAKKNMGDSQTLSDFMRFGIENYPAQDYALIMWDHGGGPLEGLCWDELFDSDHLSYMELIQGLNNAGLEKKLAWIGFDTCLMGTLEVANGLVPYADYMIASQELEPSTGWNYSFLSDIYHDENSLDTCRRIIDAYFEDQEMCEDPLTLACVELSKVKDAVIALGDVFTEVSQEISPDQFYRFSKVRKNAYDSGKISVDNADSSYDLVDAIGLVSQINNARASMCIRKIQDAVVCFRSNINDTHGLSLYHPQRNKKKLGTSWKKVYSLLNFSTKYSNYVDQYSSVLLSKPITKWNNLILQTEYLDNGETCFRMQLTQEQIRNFGSAQLIILASSEMDEQYHHVGTVYLPMATEIAVLSKEEGCIQASYSGNGLYLVKNDNYIYGPLNYGKSEQEDFYTVKASYHRDDMTGDSILYYLNSDKSSAFLQKDRTFVWDRLLQQYTNRQEFDASKYVKGNITNVYKKLPESDENGILPAFNEWNSIRSDIEIDPSEPLEFYWSEQQISGCQPYAFFQIIDLQQNLFCTQPIPFNNPNINSLTFSEDLTSTENEIVQVAGTVSKSHVDPNIELTIRIINQYDTEREYHLQDFALNDMRYIEWNSSSIIPARGEKEFRVLIRAEQLLFLQELETVSFRLVSNSSDPGTRFSPEYDRKSEIIQYKFDRIDLRSIEDPLEVIAEAKDPLVTIQLLSLLPDNSYFRGPGMVAKLRIVNNGDAVQYVESVFMNGIDAGNDGTLGSIKIPTGRDAIVSVFIRDNYIVPSDTIVKKISEEEIIREISRETIMATCIQYLYGFEKLENLCVVLKDGRMYGGYEKYTLSVNKSVPIPKQKTYCPNDCFKPPKKIQEMQDTGSFIIEGDAVSISLLNLVASEKRALILLEIENKSGSFLEFLSSDTLVNERFRTKYTSFFPFRKVTVAPKSKKLCALAFTEFDEHPEIETLESFFITFEIYIPGQEDVSHSGVASVYLNSPASRDIQGGDWRLSKDLLIKPGRSMYTNIELIKQTIDLPKKNMHAIEYELSLTEEQKKKAKHAYVLMIQENKEGKYQVLSWNYEGNNANKKNIVLKCPTLIMCTKQDPEILFSTGLGCFGSESIGGAIFPDTIRCINKDESISYSIPLERRSYFCHFGGWEAISGCRFQYPFRYVYNDFFLYIKKLYIKVEQLNESFFIEPSQWPEDQVEWYPPISLIDWGPIKIRLRPVEPEDNIYYLFEIEYEDGSGEFLSILPFDTVKRDGECLFYEQEDYDEIYALYDNTYL